MAARSPQRRPKGNELHGRFCMIAGMFGLLAPAFLFRVPMPLRLTTPQKVACGVLFVAAMVGCTLVGERRLKLGLYVLAPVIFALSSLLCWWILSTKP